LFLHIMFFFIGFLISVIILITEYAHDYWSWEVPYLRRYWVGISYLFSAIGTIFLVLFANAVFKMRGGLENLLIIFGIVVGILVAHPDNHWEIIHIEDYTFDMRAISEPVFVLYLTIVGIVIAVGAFRAAARASERKYSVALKFIGLGGLFMIMTVVFQLTDALIAIALSWHYNIAAWLSWLFIMLTSISFYIGYALPKFVLRRFSAGENIAK